jgi:hypothetical protein
MIGLMLTDRASIRKPSVRSARNKVTYSNVTDASGGLLFLPCKFDRRKRTIRNRDGHEIAVEATMTYIVTDYPELRYNWLVVDTSDGKVYRVLEIAQDEQHGSGSNIATANLTMTRQEVPVDTSGNRSVW